MKLEAERFTIKLPRPFRIAHGSSRTRETILVHIHCEGIDAHGEGALPPYYPSTAEASLTWLNSIGRKADLAAWESECARGAPAQAAAGHVALEIALQDLKARKAGKPLWQLWDLNPAAIPACWRTVSMASSEHELCEMLDEAISHGSTCYQAEDRQRRLCLGQTMHSACRCAEYSPWPRRQRRMDARAVGTNSSETWRAEHCVRRTASRSRASKNGGSFGAERVRQGIPPLVADESLQEQEDFAKLRGLIDGVNVKLLKAGGLRAALDWISLARELGLLVMVGVMVETGIARTAAAQLAPLADWLDIDPPDSIPAVR